MRRLFLLPFLWLAQPVLAGGPEGVWAHDPDWCSDPSMRIEITESEIIGRENTCEITGRTEIEGLSAQHLSLRCMGEGMVSEEERLILIGEDSLWQWFGAGDPLIFHRCSE
ncbi:hypothetical protein [Halodurantibacterium flavum]|uniref:DUF3617 family protein n=1 Tax=Halodurantibacterium flavum TaxID=1382802 RepID=A0ABW4S2C5_9RHOB